MGEVLLAYDPGLERQVAIKRILPGARLSTERRARFRREARLAARLEHSSIVRVYELLEIDGVECIVMEFVEGTTLRRLLSEGGPLPVQLVCDLAREVLHGLRVAHDQGIVHRDLKTENILLTSDAHAKISDFGVAKRFLANQEPELTRSDALVGTYRTMSPEQALSQKVDHRSDLFSFGVMLYEMLTGISPFEGRNDLLTLKRVINDEPRAIRQLNAEIPPRLARLIHSLLHKDPRERPQSVNRVLSRLRAVSERETSGAVLRRLFSAFLPVRRGAALEPATSTSASDA